MRRLGRRQGAFLLLAGENVPALGPSVLLLLPSSRRVTTVSHRRPAWQGWLGAASDMVAMWNAYFSLQRLPAPPFPAKPPTLALADTPPQSCPHLHSTLFTHLAIYSSPH